MNEQGLDVEFVLRNDDTVTRYIGCTKTEENENLNRL